MKKVYEKPEVDYVSFITEVTTTNDIGISDNNVGLGATRSVVGGEMGDASNPFD